MPIWGLVSLAAFMALVVNQLSPQASAAPRPDQPAQESGTPRSAATPGADPALLNILDYAPAGQTVDRTGGADASVALGAVVQAANALTRFAKDHPPQPACIHIPAGIYRITVPPPMFRGAGCVIGDGSAQTIINLDPGFAGDLFAWAESWIAYNTSGATVRHLRINGAAKAPAQQNALMFYDRNDNVALEDLYINDVPGRALGFGLLRPTNSAGQAYIRESHFRSIRMFGCGTDAVPAMELTSQGGGNVDGTNEVSASQIDIFAARGAGLVIRNSAATGITRGIKFDALRIEGAEGAAHGDLLQIGDPGLTGRVGLLYFTNLELLVPTQGHAAVRIAGGGRPGGGPSRIYMQGFIGGGISKGEGLRVDNGSFVQANFNYIHTAGPNVVIGPGVSDIALDGGGQETSWTYVIDPSSRAAVKTPMRQTPFAQGKP